MAGIIEYVHERLKEDFFDENWNHLNVRRPRHGNSVKLIDKPEKFQLMKALAEKLAEGFPFVRIDIYEADGRVYFGEITFYPAGGFEGFEPKEWDKVFGKWLELPI